LSAGFRSGALRRLKSGFSKTEFAAACFFSINPASDPADFARWAKGRLKFPPSFFISTNTTGFQT
jgi:hypothetical protein